MVVAAKTQSLTLRVVDATGEPIQEFDALQGTWTVEQYLRITEHSNKLIEYTKGAIEVLPMPTYRHQIISRFLLFILHAFLSPRGGIVMFSPLRLRINEDRFREPDLLLALDQDDPRLEDAYWLGADMVIEVVSKDNPERDLVEKRADYAEAGIPEYWIVNPQDDSIIVLGLKGDQYTEHGIFKRGDIADSVLLEGFSVEVDQVFDAK